MHCPAAFRPRQRAYVDARAYGAGHRSCTLHRPRLPPLAPTQAPTSPLGIPVPHRAGQPGRPPKAMPPERYIWAKQGNHLGEVKQFLQACALQNGGEVVGDPDVLRTLGHTFLAAEGRWWSEYMAGHGKARGWRRITWERIARFLDERGA